MTLHLGSKYNQGYHDCSCRDCFEIAIGVDENGNASLCGECEEAGCDQEGGQECQVLIGGYGEVVDLDYPSCDGAYGEDLSTCDCSPGDYLSTCGCNLGDCPDKPSIDWQGSLEEWKKSGRTP